MGVGSAGVLATLGAVGVAAKDAGCDAAGGSTVAVQPATASTRPSIVDRLTMVKRTKLRGNAIARAGRSGSPDMVTSSGCGMSSGGMPHLLVGVR
jgi:hypothetical protein